MLLHPPPFKQTQALLGPLRDPGRRARPAYNNLKNTETPVSWDIIKQHVRKFCSIHFLPPFLKIGKPALTLRNAVNKIVEQDRGTERQRQGIPWLRQVGNAPRAPRPWRNELQKPQSTRRWSTSTYTENMEFVFTIFKRRFCGGKLSASWWLRSKQ